MPTPSCPPGSNWVSAPSSARGGWCVAPNGSITDPSGTPIGPLPAPRTTAPPIAGIGGPPTGGGVPGAPGGAGSSPYTSLPTGYPGQPGSTFPGGGTASPVGGGTSSGGWKKQIIPAAAGLFGYLFDYLGKKKQNDAQNANNEAATAQSRTDLEGRAHAMAAIYAKMLGFYGHGDLASEDQLYNALLKTPTPVVKVAGPSALTGLGKVADSVGAGAQDYYYRQDQQQQQQQQSDVWKSILDLIMKSQNQTPVQGGTTPYPYPYE